MADRPEPDAGDADVARRVETSDTVLPRGWRAVGKGSERVRTVGEPAGIPPADDADVAAVRFAGDELDEAPAPARSDDDLRLSNAGLLGLGVLAGVYLLYTIGWFIGAVRIELPAVMLLNGGVSAGDTAFVGTVTFQILKWVAIAAPFVWFVVTFVLTRHSKAWARFAWLVAGALLLVPWPMFVPLGALGGTR